MGSKHGDTSALCKLMGTVQSWVDTPLTAAQLQTEDEGGEDAESPPQNGTSFKGHDGSSYDSKLLRAHQVRANLVVTEGNSVLSTDEIDKRVVICMNKLFMDFMRKNYPEVINSAHAKYGSVVRRLSARGAGSRRQMINPLQSTWDDS